MSQTAGGDRHLGVLAARALARAGNRPSLFFEGRWYSAADQLDAARRLTGGLRELGVVPGDRVVVLMSNGPQVSVAYTAIWRAGAVVTPVVFLLSEAELHHVLADSGSVAVVTTEEFLPKVAAAASGVPTVHHIVLVGTPPAGDTGGPGGGGPAVVPWDQLTASSPAELVPRAEDDLGALMYTGGTTGRSKGVMLSHGNLWWCGWCSYERTRPYDDAVPALVPLPLSHAFGMIVTVVGAFREEQSPAILMRWFDPDGWLALAVEHKVQSAPMVPMMVAMLLAKPLEQHDLSSLRYLACGAAPLSTSIAEEWERRVPSSIILNGYGCTESGSVISSSSPERRRAGTVGTPIPRYEVKIFDDADREMPAGDDGEICVRGPGVMHGYWNAPDATAVALRDGWLHTGDVGHLDEDGFLSIVDRKKDLIIRGGFNVYPRDVEDVLVSHPAVAMAAVVGRPDPMRGEEVVAFVSLRPGETATAEDLTAYAKERLAATKYPREVHIVDAIPLTSVGKTDRKALRASLTRA